MAYGNPVGHAVICGSELDFIHHKLTQCHNSSRPMDIIIQIHASVSLWSCCAMIGVLRDRVKDTDTHGMFSTYPGESPVTKSAGAGPVQPSAGAPGFRGWGGGSHHSPVPTEGHQERRFGAARDPTRLQTIR